MKKILVFLVTAVLILSGCSAKPEMERKSGTSFFCNKNGINYFLCSKSISAKTLGEKFSQTDDGLDFYCIPGAVPSEYISTGSDGFRCVFRGENAREYTFSDFTNPKIFVCSVTESGVISPNYIITDKGFISQFTSVFDSETVKKPYEFDIAEETLLRIESENCIPFYYYVSVYSMKDGTYLVYDSGRNLTVDASEIFQGMIL